MRTVSFEKLISLSLERTKMILFKAFSLKKWLFLIFIALMAGALNGGSFNIGNGGPCGGKKGEAQASVEQTRAPATLTCPLAAAGAAKEQFFNYLRSPAAVSLLVALIGLAIILILVAMWLCARFNFVWIEAILKNDASVREPFRRYRKEGDSFFNFFIASLLVFLAGAGLFIWGGFSVWCSVAALDKKASGYVAAVISSFAGLAVGLFVGILLFIVCWVFVEHIVITVMALEKCSFVPAWRKSCGIFGKNKKDFAVYLLVILVAGIASAVLAGICGLALLLVLALAAGVLFGLPYLLLVPLLKMKVIFIVWAVLGGIPFGVGSLLLFAAIGLPFAVFFRNLAFYFLSSLRCGYEPLALP